jgi:hypothetical protein
MGSHKRRSDSRGRGRGGRGRGGGGGGGGAGGTSDESKYNEYKKVTDARIDNFLKTKNYSQAGFLAANLAFRSTPTKELASVLLAGIVALKEGQKKNWKPKPENLARTGLESSLNLTKYELSLQKRTEVIALLSKELKKAAGGVS